MNSLSKAQICPVKFNGRPPNSLDLSISANKKNKLTINDFKKILSFRNWMYFLVKTIKLNGIEKKKTH